jgi:hypothetical protein
MPTVPYLFEQSRRDAWDSAQAMAAYLLIAVIIMLQLHTGVTQGGSPVIASLHSFLAGAVFFHLTLSTLKAGALYLRII